MSARQCASSAGPGSTFPVRSSIPSAVATIRDTEGLFTQPQYSSSREHASATTCAGGFAAARGVHLYTPVIVKYRDDKTDAATALEDALR